MQSFRRLITGPLIFILTLSASAVAQERHAVAPEELAKTVADRVARQNADRAAVREALARPEVRSVAASAGIDIDGLAVSVDTLSPSVVERAAGPARQVNQALVGGASTVTISTTTIIIALLIIILIVVAAD